MAKSWKIADDTTGQQWTIIAPDDATEQEVHGFAAENADSWVDGGTYRMELDVDTPAPGDRPATRNEQVEGELTRLRTQLRDVEAEITATPTRRFAGPTPALLGGTGTGPVTGMVDERGALARRAELDAQRKSLQDQISRLEIPAQGATVGGIGGALGGAGIGALLGAPFGPPGMVTGALIGGIGGGAAGTAAGTHLYDIPAARDIRDISDQEATELIKRRAIESLIWDGTFTLILGPGGRVIGKMAKGAKFLPAMKAAGAEAFGWNAMPQLKREQLTNVIEKRAALAPEGLTTQASRAVGATPTRTDLEATKAALTDIAERSGGHVPTKGEITGVVGGSERFARFQTPMPFFKNDQALAKATLDIKTDALKVLDDAGAYRGTDLGTAFKTVQQSADRAVKNVVGPVYDRAAAQNVTINMTPTLKYLDGILFRDMESGNSLLRGSRGQLEQLAKTLREEPFASPQAVQDIISGQKAAVRALVDGAAPTPFAKKAFGNVVKLSEDTFTGAMKTVPDKTLAKDLIAANKLYRETMTDLFSDTMAKVADKTPEDIGTMIVPGTVTEIREMRAALNRALSGAPTKTHISPKGKALGAKQIADERMRIDAGMIRGYLTQHTERLTSLPGKIENEKFVLTLKELLTGEGAANPARGKVVLEELDKTLAALRIAQPELVPQAGRVGAIPGATTGVSGTATAQAATGGAATLPVAAGLIYSLGGLLKIVGHISATAMTTGNTGGFRAFQRFLALARIAGKTPAAAEAARAAYNELEAQYGGEQ